VNNFLKRTLTAAAFVAVLLGCTYYHQYSFTALFFIITVLGVWEFYTLAEKTTAKPQKIWGTFIAAIFFITNAIICLGYNNYSILALNIPLLFSVFIIELFTKAEHPFKNIAFTLLGIFYVVLPFSLLNYLVTYTGTYSFELIFGFFFILWSNDTGAYLVGSLIGKNKLFPRISPGKTWEGSIGGALLSFIVAYIISQWYHSINTTDWMVIAGILVVIGTLGDLVESLFKRSISVKDSGNLLPGHGGILDRFDSLIMATPFVFTYLFLIKFLY